MKALLDEAMKDGAFGLSTMLAMPPGSLATTDDLVELCKVGGEARRHLSRRTSATRGPACFDAVKEAIAVGERAGVPVDIIHLKIADQKYWGRMNEVVALIEAARSARRQRAGQRLSLHPRQQQPRQHHPAVGPRRRHARSCSSGSRTRSTASG